MCQAGESWSSWVLREALKSSKSIALKLGEILGGEHTTGMSIIVMMGR